VGTDVTAAKDNFLDKQGRKETRKQQFVTCSLTLSNCGSWVLNLNQQNLQLSVMMVVRSKLQEVSLPVAQNAAFKLGFSPSA